MERNFVVAMTTLLIVSLAAPAAVGAGAATHNAADATLPSATAADANAGVQPTCEYPWTETDATGEDVTVDEEPESVVTLYPGDAQLAAEIGAEERVTGMPVSEYTDGIDIEGATDISEDDGATVDAEQVVALDPDVVLAGNVALTQDGLLETLEDAGITVYVLEQATSIDDVRENVAIAGAVTGECEGAEETTQWMDDRLELIESAVADVEKPLAFYPSDGDGWTPGADSFHDDVFSTAGVENLGTAIGNDAWAMVDAETVVDEDPEWVIYPDTGTGDGPPLADSIESTTAIENDNVVAVDANAMSQPGPQVLSTIDTILEAVHPSAYAEIEADLQTLDAEYQGSTEDSENESENETEDPSDDSDDETDEESIPGFGVPVAVAGLLAAAYHLRR